MKKRLFLKYFSIVMLVGAIGLAPVFACACQEPVMDSHACCPDNGASESSDPQAQEENPCCVYQAIPERKNPASTLVETPHLLPLTPIPEFASVLTEINFVPFKTLACEDEKPPPQAFLINHSFLL